MCPRPAPHPECHWQFTSWPRHGYNRMHSHGQTRIGSKHPKNLATNCVHNVHNQDQVPIAYVGCHNNPHEVQVRRGARKAPTRVWTSTKLFKLWFCPEPVGIKVVMGALQKGGGPSGGVVSTVDRRVAVGTPKQSGIKMANQVNPCRLLGPQNSVELNWLLKPCRL